MCTVNLLFYSHWYLIMRLLLSLCKPLNPRSLIRLVMTVWRKRGNTNAAYISYYSMVQRSCCSRQLIGPADWVFLSHRDPYAVITLEAVAYSYTVTRWSGSGGSEVYLSGQLAVSAFTLLIGSTGL